MKSILAFVGLILFLGAAVLVHRSLNQSKSQQVIVGWSNSLIWSALGTPTAPGFVDPKVELLEEPDTWRITGKVGVRNADGSLVQEGYQALLTKICPSKSNRDCWQLTSLTVADEIIALETKAQETAGDPDASSTMTAGDDPASEPVETEAPSEEPEETQTTGEEADPGADPSPTDESRQQEAQAAQSPAIATPIDDATLVFKIQGYLNARGIDVGRPDGKLGPKTRAAIEAYQQGNSLPVDGTPTIELLRHLEAP